MKMLLNRFCLIFIGLPLMPFLRFQYKFYQLWEAWKADWHGVELTGNWEGT